MKNSKKIICCVGFVLLVIVVGIIVGIHFTRKEDKSTKDMLLDKFYSGEERTEAENLYYKDINPIKIDDYTFSMDGIVYDGIKLKGSYLLIVSQDEGEVTFEEYFKRFTIVIDGGYSLKMEHEEIDGRLYFYFKFDMDLPWDEILYLYDELSNTDGHITETAVGKFPLRDIKNEREFVSGEDVLTLSPMSIDIKAKDITYKNVTVRFENGKEKVIMEDGSKVYYEGKEGDLEHIKIRWRQKIDEETVAKVIVDGKEFVAKE